MASIPVTAQASGSNVWVASQLTPDYIITRRAMPHCRRRLPLCARSVCWAIFPPGRYEDRAVRPFAKVLWGVRGIGTVTIADREQSLHPGQIAVFYPHTRHEARADQEPWEVRWWTMDGEQATSIISGFGLEREGIYDAGPPSTRLFEALRKSLEDVTLAGETRASAIAYELLGLASSRSRAVRVGPVVEAAREILELQWSDPAFDVNALASKLKTHRSSLSRLFSAAHGMSPSLYLLRLRMRHALSLLKQTQLSVKEISLRCGFRDPNYFARAFRQTQGMTPMQWRRH